MTMTEPAAAPQPSPVRSASRARWLVAVAALVLAAVDLVAKAAALQRLTGGRSVDLGMVELRLAFNSGAAFSLGAGLPSWVVVAVVSCITAGVAVFAWRAAETAPRLMLLGLSAILAGAVANLVDRGRDGVVTDYLHTGWWPTFNLADVFITVGAGLVLVASLRSTAPPQGEAARTQEDTT